MRESSAKVFALVSVNNGPLQYISIHHQERSNAKIRNKRASITSGYTVDVFPNYIKIHQQASPSITVL
jgi:hypothetical protein